MIIAPACWIGRLGKLHNSLRTSCAAPLGLETSMMCMVLLEEDAQQLLAEQLMLRLSCAMQLAVIEHVQPVAATISHGS